MNCNDQSLLKLLESDVAKASDDETIQHVELCEPCQQRLAELAADPKSWNEVVVALSDGSTSGSIVIAIDSELAPDMPFQADRISLDFLDTPSHPEMLGRIGRYDVEELIGAGGMGIVLKAFDTQLHRPVAVKVLAPHLAHNGAARQRFAREAKSAAAVVHENVVPIHNVDVTGPLPFLVMQYVAGDSLQSRIDKTGPLSTEEVLRIGAQIANGLEAAHAQGLVHRDVKPGNVLLEESVDRVLISDFGLARAADDASVTRSGVIAGTPHYMSPEQARGAAVDSRSDLFGLGSVLYFMCTGRPPFRADGAMGTLNRICSDAHRPVDEVNEQVPAELADLIDRLLEKQASKRPSRARDVATSMTRQLQDKGSHKRFRRQRSRRQLTIAALMGLALLFNISGFAWWTSNPNDHRRERYSVQVSEPRSSAKNSLHNPSPSQLLAAPSSVALSKSNASSSIDNPFREEAFYRDLSAAMGWANSLETVGTPNARIDEASAWAEELRAINTALDVAENREKQ